MTKVFRKFTFLLGVAFLGISSFGLSYFYFENHREKQQDIQDKIKVDDIQENYRFGTSSDNTTYTIYFFPSAAYMHLYGDYLENKTEIKPEEQFGYKEAQYNETGNILLDSNGNARYKLSEETGKYATYSNQTSISVSYDGAYRKYIGDEFSCDNFEADNGDAYRDGCAYTESQNALTWSDKGTRRTWGVPNEEFTIKQSDSNRIENYNGHNQYSLDRFGCWDDCYYYGQTVSDGGGDYAPTGFIEGDYPSLTSLDDTNTGRYLPIKVTVNNTMSTNIMEKVVQEIFSSMGNNDDYHNYSFTEWTYVDTSLSDDSKYPYGTETNKEYRQTTSTNVDYPIGEAFQPIPTERYFDMFSELSKYADSDGVIRLFPLFSNGKMKNATSFLNGGGAAQKLQITYGSGDDQKTEYKYPFFKSDVYDNGQTCFTYGENDFSSETLLYSDYIRLFSYNNVKITSSNEVSSLTFSANNIWGGPTGWHKIEGTDNYFWGDLYQLDSTYIQNELISKYGEGLYTFYVIVANYSYQNGPSPTSSNKVADFIQPFDSFYNNIVSQAVDGRIASLKNKHLVQILDTSNYYDDYKCSPTVVAFEKIDEPKVINDFEVSNNTVSDVNSYISKTYELADGFSRNSSSLYKGSYDSSTSSYSVVGDDLSSSSPYTYIAKNVDFMRDDSLYFMISFNQTYSTSRSFNDDVSKYQYEYLISDPGVSTDTEGATTYTFNPENVYSKATEYIDIVNVTGNDGKTYQMCKFKDTTYQGVYDILIKYNDSNKNYDIYMFRHSNLFCYVFDTNLDDYQEGEFVNHTLTTDGDSKYVTKTSGNNANLLFEYKYFLGQSLDSSSKSVSVNSGYTLDQCLRKKIGDSYDYNGPDLENYKLKDRVTEATVAKYEKNEDGTYSLICNQKIYKNYIFYLVNE